MDIKINKKCPDCGLRLISKIDYWICKCGFNIPKGDLELRRKEVS